MSGSLRTMDAGVGELRNAELLDLSDSALISIFSALDVESLALVARTSKKLNEVMNDDLFWMDLCRPWENVVNLESWRAQMLSGKTLFRLLRSLSKLVGMWTHGSCYPQGQLLYVTWSRSRQGPEQPANINSEHIGPLPRLRTFMFDTALHVGLQGICGLEGWQVKVTPTSTGALDHEVRFVKLFNVIGRPDGSHKVEFVITDEDTYQMIRRVSANIVLPSSQSQDQFLLEGRDAPSMELTSNSNGILPGSARGQPLQGSSPPVLGSEISQTLYKRLEIGEPTPEQELTGLWTGLYGPHGSEMLLVSYSDDGLIEGLKVTGDLNVPCGEISFKARTGTVAMNVPDFDHFELGFDHDSRQVTKMYSGEGRIAEENFVNPTWVPGLLVVEEGGNFHFSWGALYGSITYHRLDLEAWFRSRTPESEGSQHNAATSQVQDETHSCPMHYDS